MLSIAHILIILQVLYSTWALLPDYIGPGEEPDGPELPDTYCYWCYMTIPPHTGTTIEYSDKSCEKGPPPLEWVSKQASITIDQEKDKWRWAKHLCRTELAFFPEDKAWILNRDSLVEEEVIEYKLQLDPTKNSTCFKVKAVGTEKDKLAPITLVCFCDPARCNDVSFEKLKLQYEQSKTITYTGYNQGVLNIDIGDMYPWLAPNSRPVKVNPRGAVYMNVLAAAPDTKS